VKYLFFHREPAAIVGFVTAALTVLAAYQNVVSLTPYQVAAVGAALSALGALIIAVRTKHTTLAVVLGLFKALVALGAAYSLSLSPEQTAAVIGLLTFGFDLFNRQVTSPAAALPGDASREPHPGDVVHEDPRGAHRS
jgi:hypothetical protein